MHFTELFYQFVFVIVRESWRERPFCRGLIYLGDSLKALLFCRKYRK
ncbi:hypothetical protein HMPREF1141_2418 [Clostridium sp. MSTE9]|nr:hypothetical protein HMPREF1141_2418 [Clostridium sp. MSTE9]